MGVVLLGRVGIDLGRGSLLTVRGARQTSLPREHFQRIKDLYIRELNNYNPFKFLQSES